MSMARYANTLPRAFTLSDIALVVTVTAIVGLMVMPVPLLLLDGLIAANIMVSLVLLMMAAYVPSALALSTFPTLLMFTTLLRLSLNIASTKNILLHADAGHIIETFGRLVMGGNVVVGLVVFVIIAIVQFIVIAKGSERVAEVGARFSLDGMPGKQMSIDADLRAGILTKEDARHKRELLEKESQMHGAMDGAMKFVKGDAIAGLIIAAVNMIAGITVGMLLRGMDFGAAADRFVLLSIGDGMVSQIPSLFVSIAAGVLITRSTNVGGRESDLSTDISRQVVAQPMALLFAGAIMLVFVLVPGFPKPVFLVLGAGVIGGAMLLRRRRGRPSDMRDTPMPSFARHGSTEPVKFIAEEQDATVAPLALAFADDDVTSIDAQALDTAVAAARKQVQRTLGLPFPGMRGRLDTLLEKGLVRVLVHEVPVLELRVQWGRCIAVPSTWVDGHALPMQMPAADATWSELGDPAADGQTMVSAEALIGLAVRRVLGQQAEQFVGMQEVQRLLEDSATALPGLVEEVMRTLPLQRISEVMRRLVQEGISVRHQREILESLVTWGPREKDIVMLTEYVRVDCGRATAFAHGRGRPVLPVLTVDTSVEHEVRTGIQTSVAGTFLSLTPDQTRRVVKTFEDAAERCALPREELVVVCSMDVRRYLRRILAQAEHIVPVLSFQELGTHVQVQAAATMTFSSAGEAA
jgi:type III secretion protein V